MRQKTKTDSSNGTTSYRLAELRTALASDADQPNRRLIAFVSDLHLFSSRCHYQRHEAAVRRCIEAADICVWGGDLFDFCWSQIGDGRQSRAAAIDWLETWRAEFPDKSFVYLTGNHDAQPTFAEALQQWAKPHSGAGLIDDRFLDITPGSVHVGWDAVRWGDILLVHGDVIEGGNHPASLATYRNRWSHESRKSTAPMRVRNGIYDAAVAARLHLAAAGVAHRRRASCLRLLRWARNQPEWLHRDLDRIVFGHTHRRLDGVRVAGVQFFNGGAAVRHVGFSPVLLRDQ